MLVPQRRTSDRFPSPWLGVMLTLMLQLLLGMVAYGRLAEKVDELHDNVHVIQQLLMQRGVNR